MRKTIKFNEKFIPLIKSGMKTQTRRKIKKLKGECEFFGWNVDRVDRNNFRNEANFGNEYQVLFTIKPTYYMHQVIKVCSLDEKGHWHKTDLRIKIANIRVEPVGLITEEDAIKEGFKPVGNTSARRMFAHEIKNIYGSLKGYFFVYEFELI